MSSRERTTTACCATVVSCMKTSQPSKIRTNIIRQSKHKKACNNSRPSKCTPISIIMLQTRDHNSVRVKRAFWMRHMSNSKPIIIPHINPVEAYWLRLCKARLLRVIAVMAVSWLESIPFRIGLKLDPPRARWHRISATLEAVKSTCMQRGAAFSMEETNFRPSSSETSLYLSKDPQLLLNAR